MFDAYSLKKILPRLVIAVIAIQLSWVIFSSVIYFNSIIAYGIEGLIYAPFGGIDKLTLANILSSGSGSSGLFAGLVAAGTLGAVGAALSLGGVASLAITCLLGLFIGFTMLVLRRVLIIFLLVLSPIALVAWILPGTEKYWKLWWESFSKLLLLYPMIIGVVAIGRVFAYIAIQPSAGRPGGIGTISQLLIVLVGVFGPFFLIPKLFTLAGSAFANITGAVNNRSKGAFDRLRNRRQQTQKRNLENLKAGNRFKGGNASNFRGRINRGMQMGAHINKAGLRPGKMRANLGTAVGATTAQEIEKNLNENSDYATWKGNDTLNKYASSSKNEAELREKLIASGEYTDSQGRLRTDALNSDIARVERVRKQMGDAAFRQMTHRQAVVGGTALDYSDDPNSNGVEWLQHAVAAAGNDDAALADIIAKDRSAAMAAGRVDQGGTGFGDAFSTAQKLRSGEWTAQEASDHMKRKVLESQGPGVLAHSSMKPKAVKNLVPEMRQRLMDAKAAGPEAYERELGIFASVYDAMSQDSPDKARILADDVMRWDPSTGVNGPTFDSALHGPGHSSIQRDIESARDSSEIFRSTRREYGTLGAQQAAAQAQRQQGPPGAPQGPPTGYNPPPQGYI